MDSGLTNKIRKRVRDGVRKGYGYDYFQRVSDQLLDTEEADNNRAVAEAIWAEVRRRIAMSVGRSVRDSMSVARAKVEDVRRVVDSVLTQVKGDKDD
jgi:hypothetical protein